MTPRTGARKRTVYSSETKAACLAALLSGQMTEVQAAQAFSIPVGTVAAWKARHAGRDVQPAVTGEQSSELGDLLLEYLREGLKTLRSQQAVFGESDWIRKQGASELAVLHGITSDKVIRLIEAFQRTSDDDGALTSRLPTDAFAPVVSS